MQIDPNPEKVGHIVAEVVKLLQDKQCNPAEMGLVALYTLQVMQQFALDYKLDYPKSMTIQSPTGAELTYTVKKPQANKPNLIDITQGIKQ